MFATAGQSWVFVATVYGGLAVGLLYDLLAALRHAFHAGPIATGIADFLFWLGAACILAWVIGVSGGDGLRGYMLLGFCCGLLLYGAGVHVLLRALGRLLARATAPLRQAFARARAAASEKKAAASAKQEGIDTET